MKNNYIFTDNTNVNAIQITPSNNCNIIDTGISKNTFYDTYEKNIDERNFVNNVFMLSRVDPKNFSIATLNDIKSSEEKYYDVNELSLYIAELIKNNKLDPSDSLRIAPKHISDVSNFSKGFLLFCEDTSKGVLVDIMELINITSFTFIYNIDGGIKNTIYYKFLISEEEFIKKLKIFIFNCNLNTNNN
jgi:hypothetical protein